MSIDVTIMHYDTLLFISMSLALSHSEEDQQHEVHSSSSALAMKTTACYLILELRQAVVYWSISNISPSIVEVLSANWTSITFSVKCVTVTDTLACLGLAL